MSSNLRLVAAAALFVAWMLLLFAGHPLAGATHLFLVAALVVLPWRAPAGSSKPSETP